MRLAIRDPWFWPTPALGAPQHQNSPTDPTSIWPLKPQVPGPHGPSFQVDSYEARLLVHPYWTSFCRLRYQVHPNSPQFLVGPLEAKIKIPPIQTQIPDPSPQTQGPGLPRWWGSSLLPQTQAPGWFQMPKYQAFWDVDLGNRSTCWSLPTDITR